MQAEHLKSVVLKRFEAKFTPEPMSGCWLWTGAADRTQRGRMMFRGRVETAARVAWQLYRGPIPRDLCACHKCDNPNCVNPDHLFIGTYMENARDASRKGRLSGPHKGRAVSPTERARAITQARAGRPIGEIAAELGVAYARVRHWRIVGC